MVKFPEHHTTDLTGSHLVELSVVFHCLTAIVEEKTLKIQNESRNE